MVNHDPIKDLIIELGATPVHQDAIISKELLAGRINELLNFDFQRLVSVLYRMDINEAKLRQLLKENPGTDSGLLIADLMIERQLEKIKTRQQFKRRDNDIDENEKW